MIDIAQAVESIVAERGKSYRVSVTGERSKVITLSGKTGDDGKADHAMFAITELEMERARDVSALVKIRTLDAMSGF